MEYPIKTGEVYFLDEDGNLCIAISWQDEDGVVWTEQDIVV